MVNIFDCICVMLGRPLLSSPDQAKAMLLEGREPGLKDGLTGLTLLQQLQNVRPSELTQEQLSAIRSLLPNPQVTLQNVCNISESLYVCHTIGCYTHIGCYTNWYQQISLHEPSRIPP